MPLMVQHTSSTVERIVSPSTETVCPRHAAALLLPATPRTDPESPFGRNRTSIICT